MLFENLEVIHNSFGPGVIVSKDGKYITVKFESVEKKFVYPDSFEKFLKLSDGTVSEEILKDLEVAKAEKQKVIDKKNAENLHAMTHGIVIPGKETSIDGDDEDNRYKNSNNDEE